jgi:putative transcriptional regulator
MPNFGQDLIRSAREALEIARGERQPAFVVVPEEIDGAAIRKRKPKSL